MPVGINLLFRVGRKLMVEPLEDSGLLPGKYYRSQALEALKENDFPESLRYLRMAETHRKAQARMVAQLLILRCRMLQEEHDGRIRSLEARLSLEMEPDKLNRYQQILHEEHKAVQLLGRYIREAQDLVKKPENPFSPTQREIRPA
jgi:hypothetical protein